jgi:hypothetical protein
VCCKCPEERKRTRYVDGVNECWWHHNWQNGNYDEIPKHFGLSNYMKYYLGWKIDTDKFKKELDEAA